MRLTGLVKRQCGMCFKVTGGNSEPIRVISLLSVMWSVLLVCLMGLQYGFEVELSYCLLK